MSQKISWRQQVRELTEKLEERDKQIGSLKRHIKMLEGIIRQHINENTPSSKIPDYKKGKTKEEQRKDSKLSGKPKGSNGGTRQVSKIDEEKIVRLDEQENYLGEPINFIQKVVCEIPKVSRAKWIRYYLAQYIDPVSGEIITATHPDCPKEGMSGPNLRAMITLLRENMRLSEGQTIDIIESLYGIDNIAPATIEIELNRVAGLIEPIYNSIGKQIFNAAVKHSDETSQSVAGYNWTIYGFSTQTLAYFFSEPNKRAEHIHCRLKNDWNNVLVCDGHSIYEWYYSKQRCWSHATRKDKWLFEEKHTQERKVLHEGISGTFKIAKDLWKSKPPDPTNIWDVLYLKNRLKQIVNYKWQDDKCQKVANYIQNGWHSWFTFMFVKGVEPTNNLNERDIRKHVMKRKISGTFRSEHGIHNHCKILSVMETWKKNNTNVYHALIDQIKQNNSFLKWAA